VAESIDVHSFHCVLEVGINVPRTCLNGHSNLSSSSPITLSTPMVLRLYGSSHATCTRRVGIILREKNISFELIEIDIMKGEHKLPQYLQKQPFGQTPYIVRSLLLSIHEKYSS
jgi:glutaredoxin